MFEIRHLDPQLYRQQTRKSTLVVLVIFAVLAMSLSALAVALFGSPEGSNFRWNLAGVLLGLVATIMLVRSFFWHQNWMQPAVYGWPQATDDLSGPMEKHRQAMIKMGLEPDQYRLDPAWLERLRQKPDPSV